jgi:hypothetical protein
MNLDSMRSIQVSGLSHFLDANRSPRRSEMLQKIAPTRGRPEPRLVPRLWGLA